MTWQWLLFGPPLVTEAIVSETPTVSRIRLADLHPPRTLWLIVLLLVGAGGPALLVSLALLLSLKSDTEIHPLLPIILIPGSILYGHLLLGAMQQIRWRWHYEVGITSNVLESHRCTSHHRNEVACVEIARIRCILVKHCLCIETVDDRTMPLLAENLPGMQRQLFHWIVDSLIRRHLLPSLHCIDALEARVEHLLKPPGSKLVAEENEYSFHVEFPLPGELPDEQNRWRVRQLAIVAAAMMALAFLVFLPATIITGAQFGGCFGLCLFVGFAAFLFSLMTAISQRIAEQETHHITRSLWAADNLLIRTDARGCKKIWDRSEIKDVRVEVEIGEYDWESSSKMPDLLNLCVIKHSHPAERIHSAQQMRRAEMEWIASQLRQALHLIETPAERETAPIASASSEAITADRWQIRNV